MSSMTRLETFVNLGYKADPLSKARFETSDGMRVRRILTMAVESRAMVSIIGERGIGKTEAINTALDRIGVKRVNVERAQRERLTIADIETAIILDLSDESPKRSGETRSRQLRRIVGEASRKQRVVVCIEEAQRLHSSTLRSLKTLREIEWMGERELFTVVLIGQSDPMNRAGVSEVRLRTDCVRMQGLTIGEAGGYVNQTTGKHFDPAAIDALAELPQARNYLELQGVVVDLLSHALTDGREIVSADDVRALFASGEPTPLPRGAARKQAAAIPVASALKNVLDRHNTGGGEQQPEGRVAC